MKELLLAGMILGLLGAGMTYARPTFISSDGVKWTQNVSDEGEEEGEDPGDQGEDEGQDEDQDEGEPSPEG